MPIKYCFKEYLPLLVIKSHWRFGFARFHFPYIMEKFIVVLFLLFTLPKIQAQDYLISFSASGDTNELSFINVENLRSGAAVTLNAGEVLHLKSVLGVEMPDLYKTGILVYPNPITDEAFLTFTAPENDHIIIRLVGLSGNTVCRISKMVLQGEHCFRISGINSGMYFSNAGPY